VSRTIILGGGVAGLAAAISHSQRGDDVLLLEKQERVGGLCQTIHWHDCYLDIGPHRLFTTYPEVQKLIEEICGENLVKTRRKSSLYIGGRFIDYPARITQLARATSVARVALLAGSFMLGKMFPRADGKTYQDVIVNQYGAEMYQWFFAPYAEKTWRVPAETLSRQMADVRLPPQGIWQMLKDKLSGRATSYVKHFYYPNRGIGHLSDGMANKAMAQGAKLQTSADLQRIEVENGRVKSITWIDDKGDAKSSNADRVISTIPLRSLLTALSPQPSPELLQSANKLAWSGLTVFYALLKKRMDIKDCWLYFPGNDTCFNRAYLPQNFAPGLVPSDRSMLVLEIPANPGEALYEMEPDQLRQRVTSDLMKVWPNGQATIADSTIMRSPNVYPLYLNDYDSYLNTVINELSDVENLISLGRHGLFSYNNSDLSIKMGLDSVKYENAKQWLQEQTQYSDYRIVD
jgi:protoporphyrinogen oxidase